MPEIPCIFKATGKVVHGFGRGSKDLGIPTGWAQVNKGPVYKMVMSLGWNPFYKNEKKSMEVHVIHEFPEDFYGAELKVVVLQYLRSERDFDTLDALIATIRTDISKTKAVLDESEFLRFMADPIFRH